jgi:hypothetical protein
MPPFVTLAYLRQLEDGVRKDTLFGLVPPEALDIAKEDAGDA